MDLELSGAGSDGDEFVGDGDLDVFSGENHLPEVRGVVMLISWGSLQLAVNCHEIPDAEKAEGVAGATVQIVTNRTVQLGTP